MMGFQDVVIYGEEEKRDDLFLLNRTQQNTEGKKSLFLIWRDLMRLVQHFEPKGVPNVQYACSAVVFYGEPAWEIFFFKMFEVSGMNDVVTSLEAEFAPLY